LAVGFAELARRAANDLHTKFYRDKSTLVVRASRKSEKVVSCITANGRRAVTAFLLLPSLKQRLPVFANYLKLSQGVGKGDRVAGLLRAPGNCLLLWRALLRIGAVYSTVVYSAVWGSGAIGITQPGTSEHNHWIVTNRANRLKAGMDV